jgi:hypothetical protein
MERNEQRRSSGKIIIDNKLFFNGISFHWGAVRKTLDHVLKHGIFIAILPYQVAGFGAGGTGHG